MNKEKVSLQEIAELLAIRASISKRAADEFLKVLFQTIEETLELGEVVKIKNFGTFKLIWNEARKSVNVQTGEEIMLEGYNKVTFTPDAILKELVNEPFSHLQAVELDANTTETEVVQTQASEGPDPLRNLTEQASEIKNILQEIKELSNQQAVAPNQEKVTAKEAPRSIDIPDYVFDEEPIQEQELERIPLSTEENSDSTYRQPAPANEGMEIAPNQQRFVHSAPTEKNIKPRKPKSKIFWVFSLIFIFVLTFAGLYLFQPTVRVNTDYTLSVLNKTVAGWFTNNGQQAEIDAIIIPKAPAVADTLMTAAPVDSLQILFDTPRVYPEFIATEQIHKGSRLARMAKRYYGTSDFWVYIYEANKDRIAHPDRIPAKTLIYIPKVDPRLIDASNPRCIKKAKELHDLYVK